LRNTQEIVYGEWEELPETRAESIQDAAEPEPEPELEPSKPGIMIGTEVTDLHIAPFLSGKIWHA
jgi:hypothetical protein